MDDTVWMKQAFGWVVVTPYSDGPFLIGPFTDSVEGNIWLNNIEGVLVEDLTLVGEAKMILPESYTEASAAMREKGAAPGSLTMRQR